MVGIFLCLFIMMLTSLFFTLLECVPSCFFSLHIMLVNYKPANECLRNVLRLHIFCYYFSHFWGTPTFLLAPDRLLLSSGLINYYFNRCHHIYISNLLKANYFKSPFELHETDTSKVNWANSGAGQVMLYLRRLIEQWRNHTKGQTKKLSKTRYTLAWQQIDLKGNIFLLCLEIQKHNIVEIK